MTIAEVREKYLKFFEARGHSIIPSASLVPENDPTTLFTGSGMQPMIPYLLGEKHPSGRRIANSQKCFRAQDIEEVGDNRHTTFFEMLGNWSLGDYWKEEQLSWIFEFLIKELPIPKEKLWVTCFAGDEKLGLPKDTECSEIWGKLGMPKEHIRFYGVEENWWSRSGTPDKMPVGEPGGPDSEIFYEFTQITHDKKFGEECHPNCDCGRFMEIGNSVFMEYRKTEESLILNPSSLTGKQERTMFERLSQRNVDFGGGLERITAAVNNEPDMFKIDVFAPAMKIAQTLAEEEGRQRIIVDHLRGAVALISDGVLPTKDDRGYIVRRLIRQAVFSAESFQVLGETEIKEKSLQIVETVFSNYADSYPNLKNMRQVILEKIGLEVSRNLELKKRVFRVATPILRRLADNPEKLSDYEILADEFFMLVTQEGAQYSDLLKLTQQFRREKGYSGLDESLFRARFDQRFRKHREVSRAGVEKKFKGGLADTSESSVRYHTATHLLHQALRDVLGSEVRQKGSNITPERLRFDFAFPRKMTEQEKKKVEEIVNEKIKANLPVHKVTLPLAEAKKSGALHFFDEKYPDEVLVHYVGDSLESAYSKEFCGGPHVTNTGMLGTFRISKEEAVSAGVRRIKAVLT